MENTPEKKADELVEVYGYAIEFKYKNIEVTYSWKNHWNHKIYGSEKYALEAIEDMKSAYLFYRDDYDWRILPLFKTSKFPAKEIKKPTSFWQSVKQILQSKIN